MPTTIAADQPVGWGILGAGGIATKFATDLVRSGTNVLSAVASRSQARADAFAARFEAGAAYSDYRQLVTDPAVDVVYIATTHPQHRDQALLAIEAGKAVLIEKPVCLNAADARLVFEAAESAGVFAMEAMWMRANPLIRTAQKLISDGVIGEVRSVQAEFGLGLAYDPAHRLYDLANGGGALLDLGIYPATFAWIFLGKPDDVTFRGTVSPSGADETVAMQWAYPDRRDAQLWCSTSMMAPNRGLIIGEHGWIRTEGRFHRPDGLTVTNRDGQVTVDDPLPADLPGYGPEIDEVERCLRAGALSSPLVPPAETLQILQVLDDVRAGLGVSYPGE
ncbi:MAG: Gfo/Idh/MocA family oxidoreductase [Jatrophihabitantaceae bacterium]